MATTSENPFRPSSIAELIALAQGIASAQVRMNLHQEVAIRYGLLAALLIAGGLTPPAIISGYRTHAEQRQLHNAGRPAARRSWHTLGAAIDVDASNPTYQLFAALWRALGGRVSDDFSTDPHPGHLDFELPGVAPSPSF